MRQNGLETDRRKAAQVEAEHLDVGRQRREKPFLGHLGRRGVDVEDSLSAASDCGTLPLRHRGVRLAGIERVDALRARRIAAADDKRCAVSRSGEELAGSQHVAMPVRCGAGNRPAALHAFGGGPSVDGVELAPGGPGRADEQRVVHADRLNVRIIGGQVGRSEAGIC